ncbi:MAG: insulinase family protein [Candidatus Eisenbacteria bacterium]|nr:insulinase family protein [Candidatus Eisenbacteria bacterium]
MKRSLPLVLLVAFSILSVPDASPADRRAPSRGRAGQAPLVGRPGALLRGLLPGGLRVVIWSDPDLAVETACLVVGVGSVHDMERKQGAAAMVADMVREAWDSGGMAPEALRVRADEDAATFLLQTRGGDFPDALEVLGQRISRLEPGPGEVEAARRRAVQRFEDRRPWSPAEVALRGALFDVYGYHRSPRGTGESLAGVTPDVVHGYYSQYYRPNNAVLAVCGPLDPESVRRAAARAFSAWQYGYVPPASPREPPPLEGPVFGSAEGVDGTCAILGGALVPHVPLPERLALEVCAEALATAVDSSSAVPRRRASLVRHRLCDEVRVGWTADAAGLAYAARDWTRDLGDLAALPAPVFERLREACLLRVLADENWVTGAARATLFGWPVDTPDDIVTAADALGPERVADTARRWLGPRRWALVSNVRRSALQAAFAAAAGGGP